MALFLIKCRDCDPVYVVEDGVAEAIQATEFRDEEVLLVEKLTDHLIIGFNSESADALWAELSGVSPDDEIGVTEQEPACLPVQWPSPSDEVRGY